MVYRDKILDNFQSVQESLALASTSFYCQCIKVGHASLLLGKYNYMRSKIKDKSGHFLFLLKQTAIISLGLSYLYTTQWRD